MDITKLIPFLPTEFTIPIVGITILLVLAPKLSDLFKIFSIEHRDYLRVKRTLELLKLHSEIESIRKEKSLDRISLPQIPKWPEEERKIDSEGECETPEKEKNILTHKKPHGESTDRTRFLWGGIGSFAPQVIRLSITFLASGNISTITESGALIATGILTLIGGSTASLLLKNTASPFLCTLVGFSTTETVQLIILESIKAISENIQLDLP